MSRRNNKQGMRQVLAEMFRDDPEEYISPEEQDEQLLKEQAEELLEDPDEVLDYIEAGSERAMEEQRDAEAILCDMQWCCVVLSCIYLLGMLLVPEKLRYAIGLVVGLGVAMIVLRNLYDSIADALLMESHEATSYMKKRVMLRYALMLVAIVGTILIGGKYMGLGTILSVFNIKLSAYLQPVVRRIRTRIRREGR